jgi:hypothetical protein
MTLSRRVAKVEEALSPTGLVLRWLADAHAYGTLEAYVASILDAPGSDQPIDRLCREASEGARARLRGKPEEQIRAAVNSALRETVFRYLLVLRIYAMTQDLLDREALIDAALSANLALLTEEGRTEQGRDPTYPGRLATFRDVIAFRVVELRALGEARAIVESRYLDVHAALFPDVAAAWEEQLERTEALADMTVRLAELDGVPPAGPPDPEALSRRTRGLVADLVEPAKADALEKLGDGERATRIATDWVRSKLAPKVGSGEIVAE